MRRRKRHKKIIMRNGVQMFYCPDCDAYLNMEFRTGTNIYCNYHDFLRKAKSYEKKNKYKRELYKIKGSPGNERKYHFKGQKQQKPISDIITTRTYGTCKLWGRTLYERRTCEP